MDKPKFGVIENGDFKEKSAFKTEDEKWMDECEQDAIRMLRDTLKATKERTNGQVVGMTIVMVYVDGTCGDRHSNTAGFPTMIGALELAKHVRMMDSRRETIEKPVLGDDDE